MIACIAVAMGVAYSPQQRWYYYPRMTPDEVLLFKQYDTRAEEKNRRTVFHSAIDDPTTPENAVPRYTIECAVSAEFGLEEDKPTRVARFLSQVTSIYPDGTESTWFHGEPIKGYVPPPAARL